MNNINSNSSTNSTNSNSTNSNSSSNSSSVSTISEIPNQFSNGITFSLGPFELAYNLSKREKKTMSASNDPSYCARISRDKYIFTGYFGRAHAYWNGVHFKFGEKTSLLEVSLRQNKENKDCKPTSNNYHESYMAWCGCCEGGDCGKNSYETYNLRVTVGSYLLSSYAEGISVVSSTVIKSSEYFCNVFNEVSTKYEISYTNTKFDLSKPFYILRLNTGDILIRNSNGEWCDYIMKESDYEDGIKLAFYNCNVIVESMNSESKYVEDIIKEGTAHFKQIRFNNEEDPEEEEKYIAAWTIKRAAKVKAEAEAKVITDAKAAEAAAAAKLRAAKIKLASLIFEKYISPIVRVRIAEKKAAADKKAWDDLKRALAEEEEY